MRMLFIFLSSLCPILIHCANISNGKNAKNSIVCQLSISQNHPDNLVYKYGESKIIKERYIYNLERNVQTYLNNKRWNEYCKEEFRNAYLKYISALKENNRLSADAFGSILDSKGELGNKDEDDYWYDNKGNRISGREYRALSIRKQKKYWTFYANREVASYFNEIARAIINKQGL